MPLPIELFRLSIQRIKATSDLYLALKVRLTEAVDLSDILRALIVLLISALDHFIHELVRDGMTQIWKADRPTTPAFKRFTVSLEAVRSLQSGMTPELWISTQVRDRHSYQSFQQPERIQEAVRLFTQADFWEAAARKTNTTVELTKRQLKLLVDRRNKIAHEADVDPTYPTTRWPIDESLVLEAIEFVENLCEAIHSSIADTNADANP